jgi:hypothetical protein
MKLSVRVTVGGKVVGGRAARGHDAPPRSVRRIFISGESARVRYEIAKIIARAAASRFALIRRST